MRECPPNIRALLQAMPLNELEWVLNRYCGPHNMILSMKKFNCELQKAWVEEEIIDRHLFETDKPTS